MEKQGKGKADLRKIWLIFINTLMISSTANSGYAMISVMERVFVNKHKLLTKEELSDCTAMAQSSPGPIGINASCLIGYRVAGFPGSLVAILGVVIPPVAFMILVTMFYDAIVSNGYVATFMKGMQAGAVALVLNFAIGLFTDILKKKEIFLWILVVFAFLYIWFLDLSVFWLALIIAGAALIKNAIMVRKGGDES